VLVLFGKRLPEMGRSLGKGIIEFKKGLAGIEHDVRQADLQPTIERIDHPSLPSPLTGYKFDPYTGMRLQEAAPARGQSDPYIDEPVTQQNSRPTSSNT
jgi:TatA/E family protein of Tat protein translocase